MVFKGSFVLGILFHLNFICSFCFGNDEASQYKEDVERRQINSNFQLQEYNICHFRTGKWLSVCQELFNRLRDDSHYKNVLYLNYYAFKANDKLNNCKTVFVEVQVGFPPNIELFSTEQIGLFCYAQEPVISDYGLDPEAYPFYNRIMIYPSSMTEVRVFERITNMSTYTFVKKLNNFPWNEIRRLNVKRTEISAPHTAVLSGDYLQGLFNLRMRELSKNDILYNLKLQTLFKICTLSYGRPRYSDYFTLNKEKFFQDISARRESVILHLQGVTASFVSYTCYGNKFIPGIGRQSTEEYKMIQGVYEDDVILLQMTQEVMPELGLILVYVPTELIQNFTKEYVKFVFFNYKL